MASQSIYIQSSNRESLKDSHLNDILDKIQIGGVLSELETKFIQEYENLLETDLKDFSHLSKNQVFDKVCYLLERNKTIICDLFDKNGKINDRIISIENLFEEECCSILLKHGDSVKIMDKYLYKISYNIRKDQYNLELQGEYYEKISKENGD
jgi:hypothetical protein